MEYTTLPSLMYIPLCPTEFNSSHNVIWNGVMNVRVQISISTCTSGEEFDLTVGGCKSISTSSPVPATTPATTPMATLVTTPTMASLNCSHSSCDSRHRICYCDDQCSLYKDCCVDAESTPLPSYRTQSHIYNLLSCHRSNFESNVTINKGYLMVSRCPLEWRTTQQNNHNAKQIAMHCSNASLFLPVTNPDTNLTFRNIYCALCNNISHNQVVLWKPQYVCDRGTSELAALSSNYTQAVVMGQCTLMNIQPVNGRSCVIHESSCPPGNRSDPVYNKLVKNCMSGETLNLHTSPSVTEIYKNRFCAECNGVNDSRCYILGTRLEYPPQVGKVIQHAVEIN